VEIEMALLRQCLREVRVKQGEWDVPAHAWPEAAPRQAEPSDWRNSNRHANHAGKCAPSASRSTAAVT
jgi:hypothetical protein